MIEYEIYGNFLFYNYENYFGTGKKNENFQKWKKYNFNSF